MKKMAKIATLVATVMAVAIMSIAMVGCGPKGRKIEGTYTVEYPNSYVTLNPVVGSMYHVIGQTYADSKVEFKTDGTYSYTKHLKSDVFGLDVLISYSGQYSDGSSETSYILNKPTAATWSIIPGHTCMQGWGDGVGHSNMMDPTYHDATYTGTLGDPIYFNIEEQSKVIDFFLSELIVETDTEGMADNEIYVEIQLDETNKTFSYLFNGIATE